MPGAFKTGGLAAVACLLAWPSTARAHFPWLATDEGGRVLLFFGETFEDRTYKVPEAVATAEVFARSGEKREPIALEPVDEDDFIGRRSSKPAPDGAALECVCDYGLYHSMLLTYHVKHLPAGPAAWKQLGPSQELRLDAVPKPADDGGLTLTVTWNGKPLAEADVSLTDAEGGVHEAKTDAQGEATFADVPEGLVGVGYNVIEDVKGEVDGEEYFSHAHYGTLTFMHTRSNRDGEAASDAGSGSAALGYPELPEPVSSFGAATADGWLYIYGGHVGVEHAHSRDNLSSRFLRLEIDGGRAWEELPMQTPLQGLPLVERQGKLYRVGGLSARNAAGEEAELHSVDEFAAFDPATRSWTPLPPLPEPRSSHDATVVGDVLYVVGGWTLDGGTDGAWLDTAWSFDLSRPESKWKALPEPPFLRRALAVASWNGQLVVIGGIDDNRDVSRRVDALDLKSGAWRQLPDLPGERLAGFGVAAVNVAGRLYVSGMHKSLLRLAEDGDRWETVATLQTPRFFHRVVAGRPGRLLSVAGASQEGHLAGIEELTPRLTRGAAASTDE